MTKESEFHHNPNAERILAHLASLGVVSATIEFSGSGDSGQVNCISIFDKDRQDLGAAHLRRGTFLYEGRHGESTNVNLYGALERWCDDELEVKHPGWEINDGSSGQMEIELEDGKFKVWFDMRQYYTESEDCSFHVGNFEVKPASAIVAKPEAADTPTDNDIDILLDRMNEICKEVDPYLGIPETDFRREPLRTAIRDWMANA